MVSFGRGGQRLLIVCPLKMEFQQLFMAPFFDGIAFWICWYPYPYAPWDWYIYLHGWLKLMVNVGKYSSPMEHMGWDPSFGWPRGSRGQESNTQKSFNDGIFTDPWRTFVFFGQLKQGRYYRSHGSYVQICIYFMIYIYYIDFPIGHLEGVPQPLLRGLTNHGS